jgi:hypothetical protein
MSTKYEPFPIASKVINIIKGIYNIATDEEAGQPAVLRKFFDEVVGPTIEVPEVEKEDRDIEMNGIKVNISILRPVGYKDKVLPTILFL